MGIVKDLWTQADDTGWFPNGDGKYVCKDCIEDDALQQIVEANLESNQCSYCEKEEEVEVSAPLDKVTEHIAMCILRKYDDPANAGLPYESREGGYQCGTIYTTEELLSEEIGFWVENENLMKDICSSFVRDDWTIRDWLALDPEQRKLFGWRSFKSAVKNKRRYTFWSMDDEENEHHPDYMPVGNMLNEILEAIKSINVIKTMPVGSHFWRVRVHEREEVLSEDKEFSSPTIEQSKQPNRMSPAGIPMFYGAEDFETAYIETVDEDDMDGKIVSGACFSNLIDLNILDLTDIPSVPSFFDETRYELRNELIFMLQFARDISNPITRDGREHIEYVPTPAFTEYIRWMVKTSSGDPIDGICYRSSMNERKCYVLFFSQEECIGNPQYRLKDQRLKFAPDSLRSVDPNGKIKR